MGPSIHRFLPPPTRQNFFLIFFTGTQFQSWPATLYKTAAITAPADPAAATTSPHLPTPAPKHQPPPRPTPTTIPHLTAPNTWPNHPLEPPPHPRPPPWCPRSPCPTTEPGPACPRPRPTPTPPPCGACSTAIPSSHRASPLARPKWPVNSPNPSFLPRHPPNNSNWLPTGCHTHPRRNTSPTRINAQTIRVPRPMAVRWTSLPRETAEKSRLQRSPWTAITGITGADEYNRITAGRMWWICRSPVAGVGIWARGVAVMDWPCSTRPASWTTGVAGEWPSTGEWVRGRGICRRCRWRAAGMGIIFSRRMMWNITRTAVWIRPLWTVSFSHLILFINQSMFSTLSSLVSILKLFFFFFFISAHICLGMIPKISVGHSVLKNEHVRTDSKMKDYLSIDWLIDWLVRIFSNMCNFPFFSNFFSNFFPFFSAY